MSTRKRISEHFVIEEFDCHNGTRVPTAAIEPLREWARVWGEPLRRKFGAVTVLSGFRTELYNRSIGGAPASFHVYDARVVSEPRATAGGVAADLRCATGTPAQWQAWALARGGMLVKGLGPARGGVGRYPTFVHLDTGPRRTWAG